MAQQSYLVKILSGSNAGGEIELYSSSICIGNTDDCDIILGDPFLEERKFNVEIFEEHATITCNGLAFYLDGHGITTESFDAPFYSVITVGSTSFVIGESGVLWPDITVPEGFHETPAEEVPASTDDVQQNEDVPEPTDDSPETDDADYTEEAESDTVLEEENTASEDTAPVKKRRTLLRIAIISIVILLIIAAGFGIMYLLRGPSFASQEYLKAINALIKKNGYTQIRIGIRKPDLLILTGFVEDKKSIDALENLIYKKAPKVLLLIKYAEQIVREIEQKFKEKHIYLQVRFRPAGLQLSFVGYIKDEAIQNELEESLRPLLIPFKTVSWKTVFWKDIEPELRSDWTARKLYDYLKATPHNFTIQIDGQLTPTEKESWEEGKQSLLTQFNLLPSVITESISDLRTRKVDSPYGAQLGDTKNTSSVLGEDLRYILGIDGKKPPSATLADLPEGVDYNEVMRKDPCKYISISPGEILFVRINGEQGLYSIGSMLPGNFTIKDILDNTIILEDSQGTYTFCPQTIEP